MDKSVIVIIAIVVAIIIYFIYKKKSQPLLKDYLLTTKDVWVTPEKEEIVFKNDPEFVKLLTNGFGDTDLLSLDPSTFYVKVNTINKYALFMKDGEKDELFAKLELIDNKLVFTYINLLGGFEKTTYIKKL